MESETRKALSGDRTCGDPASHRADGDEAEGNCSNRKDGAANGAIGKGPLAPGPVPLAEREVAPHVIQVEPVFCHAPETVRLVRAVRLLDEALRDAPTGVRERVKDAVRELTDRARSIASRAGPLKSNDERIRP